mgnify:CR=1 FL=1
MGEAKLKPGGVILIIGFAAAIVGFGFYAHNLQKQQQNQPQPGPASTPTGGGGNQPVQNQSQPQGGGEGGESPLSGTTESKFEEVGKQGPPQLQARQGSYSWNKDDPTVVFPINIWAGWGPIIAANDGFAAGSPNSVFKKYGFKLELRLIDDPVKAAEAYAAGQAHTMWGTLDMIALFAPQLKKAGLTPKVFQQVDWSQGGDGVVARAPVRTVKDLAGKTVALCQNSPSHYYLLRLLQDQGIPYSDVKFRFTSTAFGASALFAQDRTVQACVSWAPDIYTLTDPEKNPGAKTKLISTTADAANLIADVWAVRPDFARDHPEIIEGLIKGIFEGVDMLRKDPDRTAALMAQGYGFPVEECKGMLGDALPTGLGENVRFFLSDVNENKANFVGTWNSAIEVYRAWGAFDLEPVPASEVMDGALVKKILDAGEFAHQKEQERAFAPMAIDPSKLEASADDVLKIPFRMQFKPNQWDLDPKYDESIPETMKKIQELCQRYAGARIIIEGNVDTSKKNEIRAMGQRQYAIMAQAVQELSEKRAAAVREALLKALPKDDPNRFVSFGNGWDNPIDLLDQTKNRRVDVRVVKVE